MLFLIPKNRANANPRALLLSKSNRNLANDVPIDWN